MRGNTHTLPYGLKGREPSLIPILIALGEWKYLIQEVRKERGVRANCARPSGRLSISLARDL
ncbi:protein of unknown function [Candidatus Filomicrobium marinum]|uniref:Uncharacterized protein n=1 Tax=Candidatus Filomicrobium marinum TaxID=1608628 RepID=A0A0D6JHY0_9HYPH|nr:protein of unknown function [Candidatus Filomicrobium marinum]CPR20625.1 protein of unknown function [Candidatus Filomicrobium marinum]